VPPHRIRKLPTPRDEPHTTRRTWIHIDHSGLIGKIPDLRDLVGEVPKNKKCEKGGGGQEAE
jgi:hypothetical protein